MSDAITRLNTALRGRCRVERPLGEGGMATVYLARDLKHDRSVALKVLRPELAAVVGAERFLADVGSPEVVLADRYRRDGSGTAGPLANYDVTPSGVGFVMVEDSAP